MAVLLGEDQAGKVYELGGDAAFTLANFAAEITAVAGTAVVCNDLPAADYVALLASFDIPEAFAGILADSDQGLARGELVQGNDLRRSSDSQPPLRRTLSAQRSPARSVNITIIGVSADSDSRQCISL